MKEKECDGGCSEHVGEVSRVEVMWQGKPIRFNYCETAIAEDIRRGFEVAIIKDEQ